MQLIRFGEKGKEKPGIRHKGKRKDCSIYFKDWNADFFRRGGMKGLQMLLDHRVEQLPLVPEDARWGSPIARPGMILCVGLNYSDHAAESGMETPKEPVLFMKATNTISGPYDEVLIPVGSTKLDWEVELGIIMGQDAYNLKDEKAAEVCIAGYSVVHDLSERAFQLEKGGQWVKGKSCPGFSPVGPYLVSKDEVGSDINDLDMILAVNNETRQKGNTKKMIFKTAHIVWYASQFMQLEAGDLILTGTPPGVGLGMKPPVFLQDGDKVELEIEGLGRQKQKIVRYPSS